MIKHRWLALPLLIGTVFVTAPHAQEPQAPPAGRGRRVSPPQPQQTPGADYFVGTWEFTWTGRESPVSSGPRAGTVTYAHKGAGDVLELRTEGKSDDGGAYTETGTAEWNAGRKTLTLVERLSTGLELRSVGDWSSPIGIRAESDPVKAGSQTIRVRRLYSILSPQSFMVTEEISVNGGPYQRLGNGRYQKRP